MAIKSKNTDGGSSLRSRLQILIPSAIVLAGVAVSALYADLQQQRLSREAARNAVGENLGLIRTKLEANINANIKLLQGMVAVIGTEPYVTQKRFEALASSLLSTPSQIGNIVAAPNLITSFVHPYEDNKSFIGNWILPPPNGEEAVRQLREEGKTIISGPLPLKNGAMGLIITLPVEMTNDDGKRVFWGGLAGVVDVTRLYDDSGLRAPDSPLAITITDDSQQTGNQAVIYGDSHVLTDDPVTMIVDLGNEKWAISAVPKGGWHAMSRPDVLIRSMIAAMSALIAGSVIWVAGLMRERQRNYAALRQREEELLAMSYRLGVALESSRIGVWEMDVGSDHLIWDERLYNLYGLTPDTPITGETWRSMVDPEDVDAIEEGMRQAIENQSSYTGRFRVIRPDGKIVHFRTVGTAFGDQKNKMLLLGVNWDVSADVLLQEELSQAQRETAQRNEELETARQRMEYNSLHDALTGLPNRRYLDQRLEALAAAPDRPEARLTVLHMDLDRFKEINDTLGHGAGDAILRHVAQELQSMVGECDFVARIGGDEFVIVCQGCDISEGYEAMGSNLISAVNRPIVYNGHECRVGASIGIADRIEPELTAEQLLVNADIALYEAKRRGRNRVERFNDQLRARTINIKRTADAILRSLGDDDFIAWYQPQFDARTLAINGVEALARWHHPQKGILAPNAFLETAENLNVVSQIDASILDQALEQLARWKTEGLGIEHVSVNISAQRLFEDKLLDHLAKLDFKPGSLSFELLESISFDDKADAVAESLERIRTQGIAIEIDDFGTGYASILSLIKLSPSRLKIDRQLVAPIVTSPAQRKLISSIVDIGRSYGIGIVAEGVETMEHAAILRDLGCQTLQGYALARPMSPDNFIDFARKHALQREDLLRRSA
ncbi:bifunctional diguanylate cyclase/phosphodiesterase [Agrobacterium sp. RAC06]|uniref:bifunctional diguanylate cyclase/phosphodiesterase n=1 Tax=Agrobacterium sp. RAC06 TaxID=1842536 RepID=UPI0008586CCE|nr:EAL domain-containing protein [Agrobacterium sp. RAC06]AOG09715.1 diguanylate cyclase domain protein [Agrobacterium sp. RAC06]